MALASMELIIETRLSLNLKQSSDSASKVLRLQMCIARSPLLTPQCEVLHPKKTFLKIMQSLSPRDIKGAIEYIMTY